MKRSRFISIFMLAVIVFSVSGCGEKPDPKPEKKEKARVTVDYFEEDKVKNIDKCIKFTDPQYKESEYLTELLINTDQTITDVKLIRAEEGGFKDKDIFLYRGETIYKTKKLTSDKPLIFKTEFPNYMRNLALTYKDTTGKKKVFSISMSGNDSSIITEPAKFKKDNIKKEKGANVIMLAATEDMYDECPEYYEFSDPVYNDLESQVSIMIDTDNTVTNIRIMDAAVGTTTDEETGFNVNSIIYENPQLDPGVPIIYKTELPGSMPTRLISYTDITGEEKIYSLSLSGKDGSLVVHPAFIED